MIGTAGSADTAVRDRELQLSYWPSDGRTGRAKPALCLILRAGDADGRCSYTRLSINPMIENWHLGGSLASPDWAV